MAILSALAEAATCVRAYQSHSSRVLRNDGFRYIAHPLSQTYPIDHSVVNEPD